MKFGKDCAILSKLWNIKVCWSYLLQRGSSLKYWEDCIIGLTQNKKLSLWHLAQNQKLSQWHLALRCYRHSGDRPLDPGDTTTATLSQRNISGKLKEESDHEIRVAWTIYFIKGLQVQENIEVRWSSSVILEYCRQIFFHFPNLLQVLRSYVIALAWNGSFTLTNRNCLKNFFISKCFSWCVM